MGKHSHPGSLVKRKCHSHHSRLHLHKGGFAALHLLPCQHDFLRPCYHLKNKRAQNSHGGSVNLRGCYSLCASQRVPNPSVYYQGSLMQRELSAQPTEGLLSRGGAFSMLRPSRSCAWRACRSRHRPCRASPAQRGCSGRTFRLLPSSSARRPLRRTTWS